MAVPVDTLRAIRSLNTLGASGALSAHSYLLPQQAPAPAVQQAPYDDGLEAITQGLQHVRGETSEYYKKVAALKSFMHNVQSNLGIDVRTPDLSRPESIELNQIYQDALTDIMTQGNKLKQSGTMENMLINQGAIFFDDPRQMAVADMSPQRNFMMNKLEPIVTEHNDRMQQAHYAGAYDLAEQMYAEKKAYYEQKIKENPDKAEYYTTQLNGLVRPRLAVHRPSTSRKTDYDKRRASADNAIDVALRKAVNFADATTPQWETSNKPVPGYPDQFFRINKEYSGMQYGDHGVIHHAIMDPVNGTMSFIMKGGQAPVEVNKKDVVPMLLAMVDRNPRFGFTGAQMYDYIQRKQLDDGTGALRRDPFLATEEERKANESRMLSEQASLAEAQSKIKEELNKRAEGKKWFLIGKNDRVPINIPMGTATSISLEARGNGKFTIENFNEVFPVAMFKDPQGKTTSQYTKLKNATTEKPITEIADAILPYIPKQNYKQLFDALGLDYPGVGEAQDSSPAPTTNTGSGTVSADNRKRVLQAKIRLKITLTPAEEAEAKKLGIK